MNLITTSIVPLANTKIVRSTVSKLYQSERELDIAALEDSKLMPTYGNLKLNYDAVTRFVFVQLSVYLENDHLIISTMNYRHRYKVANHVALIQGLLENNKPKEEVDAAVLRMETDIKLSYLDNTQ